MWDIELGATVGDPEGLVGTAEIDGAGDIEGEDEGSPLGIRVGNPVGAIDGWPLG
jgi:hypothetical protein